MCPTQQNQWFKDHPGPQTYGAVQSVSNQTRTGKKPQTVNRNGQSSKKYGSGPPPQPIHLRDALFEGFLNIRPPPPPAPPTGHSVDTNEATTAPTPKNPSVLVPSATMAERYAEVPDFKISMRRRAAGPRLRDGSTMPFEKTRLSGLHKATERWIPHFHPDCEG